MKTGQVIFGIATALVVGGVIYFGFVKKYADGMTWYDRVTTPPLDRAGAIIIIEQASGGKKMTGTYNDDYLIARAKSMMAKEEFFYLNDRKNKYDTKTGRAVSI